MCITCREIKIVFRSHISEIDKNKQCKIHKIKLLKYKAVVINSTILLFVTLPGTMRLLIRERVSSHKQGSITVASFEQNIVMIT